MLYIYIYIKTTLCSSCNIADVDLIERIIISVKYQLYEDEKDQTSELIIEVKMRWLFDINRFQCCLPPLIYASIDDKTNIEEKKRCCVYRLIEYKNLSYEESIDMKQTNGQLLDTWLVKKKKTTIFIRSVWSTHV